MTPRGAQFSNDAFLHQFHATPWRGQFSCDAPVFFLFTGTTRFDADMITPFSPMFVSFLFELFFPTTTKFTETFLCFSHFFVVHVFHPVSEFFCNRQHSTDDLVLSTLDVVHSQCDSNSFPSLHLSVIFCITCSPFPTSSLQSQAMHQLILHTISAVPGR